MASLERALTSRFAYVGFVPFDVKLFPKPSTENEDLGPRWGGYQLEFKLIDEKRHRSFGSEIPRLRREEPVGVTFSISIPSKDEREFHRADWPAVRGAVAEQPQEFDFYFDFVLRELEPLHTLWVE